MNVTPRRAGGWAAAVAASLAGALLLAPDLADRAGAQPGIFTDERFAGLQWTFVRVRYNSQPMDMGRGRRRGFWDDPWAIDAPAAEENLSRRVRSVTSINVGDPVVLTIDDEKLWHHPWLYIVEPSNLWLSEVEAAILREFLLRGGTLTFDDFHGPFEWEHTAREIRKIFPDREIVELTPPHPVYTSFYAIDRYPQIPGLGSFFNGRTWEKGGYVPSLRAVLDDQGRAMMLINFNTDMGDGWEWSNAADYPGYLRFTAESYQMMINQIVYTLTH
ncbi:MAG: DUF4159 domain-containing protein [Vicinamibacterales bacterium]|nr:DUF4159 domain-containing protein [Vicinamibacterales bacterium]